jgi:hypothetical protein
MAIVADDQHVFGREDELGMHARDRAGNDMVHVARRNAAALAEVAASFEHFTHHAPISGLWRFSFGARQKAPPRRKVSRFEEQEKGKPVNAPRAIPKT